MKLKIFLLSIIFLLSNLAFAEDETFTLDCSGFGAGLIAFAQPIQKPFTMFNTLVSPIMLTNWGVVGNNYFSLADQKDADGNIKFNYGNNDVLYLVTLRPVPNKDGLYGYQYATNNDETVIFKGFCKKLK